MDQHAKHNPLPTTPDNPGVAVSIGPFNGFLKWASYSVYRLGKISRAPGRSINYAWVLDYLYVLMDPALYRHFSDPEDLSEYIGPDIEEWGKYLSLIHQVFKTQGIGDVSAEKKKKGKAG